MTTIAIIEFAVIVLLLATIAGIFIFIHRVSSRIAVYNQLIDQCQHVQ